MKIRIEVQVGRGKSANKIRTTGHVPDSEQGWLSVVEETTDLVKMLLGIKDKPAEVPDGKP